MMRWVCPDPILRPAPPSPGYHMNATHYLTRNLNDTGRRELDKGCQTRSPSAGARKSMGSMRLIRSL